MGLQESTANMIVNRLLLSEAVNYQHSQSNHSIMVNNLGLPSSEDVLEQCSLTIRKKNGSD